MHDLRRVTLKDGTRALIRALVPADRDNLAAGFDALSPASRRLRFHSAGFRLGRRELDLLMDVDGIDHVALVATERDGTGLGLARYVRDPANPGTAEPAVTVIDRHQRRGVGSALLAHLVEVALANGIEAFSAPVLSENRAMIGLLAGLGVAWRREGGGVLTFEADLRSRARTSPVPRPAAPPPGSSPSPTR